MTTNDITESSIERRPSLDAQTRTVVEAAPGVAKSRRAPRTADSAPAEQSFLAPPGIAETVDRSLHAAVARYTAGLSPSALALAYLDWAAHLAATPGKGIQLAEKAARKSMRLFAYACRCGSGNDPSARCIEPLPQDRRFASERWQQFPFNLIYQAFLLNQQWWHVATTGIRGVSSHHENVVAFASRHILDMLSPSNR